MKKIILAILLTMLITSLGLFTPFTSGQGEEVKLKLELEPEDCGRVYAEPPGENYTYKPGTMVQIYAEQAEGCKFAYWVSDLAGLNGSLNNPVTVTLFSDAYFKAVFVRVGAPKPGGEATQPRTHAFLRVTANVSRFQEEVRLVPIGEEVTVSVPRDIYLNDTARYVFVGWDGYESREPYLRVLVKDDTTVKALYTLYVRFMELWYHYSDFIVFYAPIVEARPGERLRPVHLTLKPMNITLPVGSSIPREFSDRVEVRYQKEYLLTIRSLAPENIPVMVNGEAINLIGSIEKWIPEGSKADIRVLVDETERGWIREPKQLSLIMNSPVSIVVEYEEKPYSWALESPLKPLLYPILETVARSYKGTGMWPQVSQIISQPAAVYAMFFSIPAGFAGIGYLCYRVISRIGVGGLKIGRARKIIEERIRRASPEEIMSVIPSSTTPTPMLSREEIKLPEYFELPDWLRISKVEVEVGRYKPVSMEKTEKVEVKETVEELGEVEELEEEVRSIDVLELISRGGEVRADELIEALMNRLDEEVLEKLRSAVLSGELKVTALRNTVWNPVKVRKIFKALDVDGMIALVGSDHYTRKKVAEWAGIIEREVTGKPYMVIESAYEKDTDNIAARIGGLSLVVLGEGVGLDVTRAYASTAKLLDVKLIKLGVGPLRTITIEDPSIDELAAYMVAKATLMGLIDRIGLGEVWEISRIASMSRSYDTIDEYLGRLSSGPMEIESFRKTESEKLFDEYEREAVAVWQETKSIGNALAHYSNILAQIDPANMNLKLELFKEKLNKMAKGMEEARRVRVKPRVEVRETGASELKAKLAEKYTPILKNIKDEEVRRKLLRYLGMEGRHEKKS